MNYFSQTLIYQMLRHIITHKGKVFVFISSVIPVKEKQDSLSGEPDILTAAL